MTAPQIVVAGTGKMARDVGMFFLGRGHPVAWLSRDASRLSALERWVRRRARRLEALRRDEGSEASMGEASFALVGATALPWAELFIECINEQEEDKRALLAAIDGALPGDALRVTNSSSIAPEVLPGECAGLHFFYPVELTGFVEAVFPEGFSRERRQRLLSLIGHSELECIEEEGEAAFAVNRLLLPVQAEAMWWVMAGCDPAAIDEASSSEILPVGQLTLMDAIGLDVVHPAVVNFMGRLSGAAARQYLPLRNGLAQLLELGKRGQKNRDGLRRGGPLPWPAPQPPVLDQGELADRFRCLFVNTCHHALDQGVLRPEQLALALAALFDWDRPLDRALAPLTPAEAGQVLARAHASSRRPYLVPARALRGCDERAWPEPGLVI